MPPLEFQAPGRIGFEHLAGVDDAAVGEFHLPLGAHGPVAFLADAKPEQSYLLRPGEGVPDLLRRRADVGHIDESIGGHGCSFSRACLRSTRARTGPRRNFPIQRSAISWMGTAL